MQMCTHAHTSYKRYDRFYRNKYIVNYATEHKRYQKYKQRKNISMQMSVIKQNASMMI